MVDATRHDVRMFIFIECAFSLTLVVTLGYIGRQEAALFRHLS